MKRTFEAVRDDKRKTDGEITLPARATMHSAGYDFVSPVSVEVQPGKPTLIWTDVKASMPDDEVLLIYARSSMGKKGVVLANGTGIIDADYYGNEDNDGNIGIMLMNHGTEPYVVEKGQRIAQGIFMKFYTTTEDETKTVRGGGFGST